jgi:hypothetical protein
MESNSCRCVMVVKRRRRCRRTHEKGASVGDWVALTGGELCAVDIAGPTGLTVGLAEGGADGSALHGHT